MENNAEPDLNSVTRLPPADVSTGDDELDSARIEARQYLEFYTWVSAIKGEYLGYGAEGMIYIFLFEIETNRADVNPWTWVIVGDVPPRICQPTMERPHLKRWMGILVPLKSGLRPRATENP
ncbi:hypothetical protein [Mesorhizobium sp.]|uniref:hypothetical protein n=1 Tax=Mesorhizobium sp. TaxID=1871066 RepID=UPI000FE54DDB|nr:hypothetical protein [Mesorhizobium sp.]RWO81560.1 MAG: hypothetical protein EOQ96_24875 [Mesorhizobium sp.]